MTNIVAEIEAVLRKTEEVWDKQDYSALKALWDKDDDQPYYGPEEWEAGVIAGWPNLSRYWDPVPGKKILIGIRNRYSNVKAKLVGEDVAVAVYDLRYDMQIIGQKPLGGNDRIMAVFRKKPDGWKYTAYIEAPLNPMTLVRKLYQESVPDDFQDYLKEIGADPNARGAKVPWGSFESDSGSTD